MKTLKLLRAIIALTAVGAIQAQGVIWSEDFDPAPAINLQADNIARIPIDYTAGQWIARERVLVELNRLRISSGTEDPSLGITAGDANSAAIVLSADLFGGVADTYTLNYDVEGFATGDWGGNFGVAVWNADAGSPGGYYGIKLAQQDLNPLGTLITPTGDGSAVKLCEELFNNSIEFGTRSIDFIYDGDGDIVLMFTAGAHKPKNNKYFVIDNLSVDFYEPAPLPDHIEMASIFHSGCVLQRDEAVKLWGTAQANEILAVTVNAQAKNVTADGSGDWSVVLNPEEAGGPYTLSVTGLSPAVVLTNVYFGDVWLLTGQSNMEWPLDQNLSSYYYPSVPNETDDFDNLRLMMLDDATSGSPASEADVLQPWCRWEAANLQEFSTVGYFFARYLHESLNPNGQNNVPLGFITAYKGWTAAEEWTSAAALGGMGETLIESRSNIPSIYFNGMIAPIQDYAIKGVLWYQGEGNSQGEDNPTSIERSQQYDLLLETMLDSWRTQWGIDFPFYFVQLAAFGSHDPVANDTTPSNYYDNWAWIRESMTDFRDRVSNAEMACIVDTGFQWNVHPPYKDVVADRLYRIALNQTYGIYGVKREFRGPIFSSVQVNGSEVVLTFDHVSGGLQTKNVNSQSDAEEIARGLLGVSVRSDKLAGFTLCGADKTFYAATDAEIISTNQVRISNVADVPAPVSVRYAWQGYPRCNLFNSAGLPAEPFRTDSYAYDTSFSADSTPVSQIVGGQAANISQFLIQIDLTAVFTDVEDPIYRANSVFSVIGNTSPGVVGSAFVINEFLVLNLTGVEGISRITVQIQDSAGNTADTVFDFSVADTTYQAWKNLYFSPEELDDPLLEETVWGDFADPDEDGENNVTEFALGGIPLDENDKGHILLSKVGDIGGGTQSFVCSYPRRAYWAEAGLTYSLLSSTNLLDGLWSVAESVPAGVDSDGYEVGIDAVINNISIDNYGQKAFFKLQVMGP